jgi:hypothetical protein
MQEHSYEELRDILVDILVRREKVYHYPEQLAGLASSVAEVFTRRATPQSFISGREYEIHKNDAELVLDIFWDLFRQGYVRPGLNRANPNLPFFQLSRFGSKALLDAGPYRFHDASSYLNLVKAQIADVSSETIRYLDEAVAAFYADCMLAACVMLGVAAENEFSRLVQAAISSSKYQQNFSAVRPNEFIRTQITKFRTALEKVKQDLPKQVVEDIDVNLAMIQSVLRIARNEAGHPSTTAPPSREQVYIFIQMFVPFGRQIMLLRQSLV